MRLTHGKKYQIWHQLERLGNTLLLRPQNLASNGDSWEKTNWTNGDSGLIARKLSLLVSSNHLSFPHEYDIWTKEEFVKNFYYNLMPKYSMLYSNNGLKLFGAVGI